MPLHRSLVFWLGAFVLTFLLWIWGRSMHDGIIWDWRPGSRQEEWTFTLMDARLTVKRVKPEAGYDLRTYFAIYGTRSFWNVQTTEGAPWFSSPALEHSRKDTFIPPDNWPGEISQLTVTEAWKVAWWVLVAAYLPPWLALSAWRARRIAKISQGALP